MKKLFILVVVLLLSLGGYIVAGPYITVSAIQSGIAENNPEKLERYIDFIELRKNIKAQLIAKMEESDRESEKNIFSSLMSGIKAKLVESMVESLITPKGLANLVEGRNAVKSLTADDPTPKQNEAEEKENIFKDARFTYDSVDSFSIRVPTEGNEEIRFVLQRQGISWKLVNLILNQNVN
ncbi:DUF2939 domain-containing protein [Saccharophagus sp. K07]|jgi:hypothetical protein|uniref:DUF2939 domain-containing protein n=1 Tax=Saccharophagus sp. K07 TaxID=2283636 RepID=UPI001651DC88|nr:DUF2939 domain-containing protein [Saccharophagus sp. K07]MBC6904812.1 DUF2939 domain-containing protein [Saccharophagus sp. K07]